jgi:hypothetical protein
MKRRPQKDFAKHDRTLNRSPQNRRLDSIARLLNTKDGVCTAICFNNGRFLLANNAAEVTTLQKEYISFFRACLIHGPEYLKTKKFHEKYQNLLAASIRETARPGKHLEKAINAIEELHVKKQPLTPARTVILKEIAADLTKFRHIPLANVVSKYLEDQKTDLSSLHQFYKIKLKHDENLAHERLSIDIDKVVHALTSNDAHAFADDIKAAFRQPFLFIGQDTPKLHAEMKILDYLYVTGQLNLDTTLDSSTEPIYLGISKLCCLECAATVQSLNEHIIEQFEAQDTEKMDNLEFHAAEAATTTPRQHYFATAAPVTPPGQMSGATKPQESPIQTRGFHLNSFPGWQAPYFLKFINKKYQQALAEFSQEITTRHLPGFSPSPAAKVRPPTAESDAEHDHRQHLSPPPPPDFGATAASAHPVRLAPEVTSTMPGTAHHTDSIIEIWDKSTITSTPAAKHVDTPATTAHRLNSSPPGTVSKILLKDDLDTSSQHGDTRLDASTTAAAAAATARPKPVPKGENSGKKHVPHEVHRDPSFTARELAKRTPAATTTKKPTRKNKNDGWIKVVSKKDVKGRRK